MRARLPNIKGFFDRLQDAKTADECRKIIQRAIVLTKEHKFEQLRQEFGVL